MSQLSLVERAVGCMIGGAYGDMLGAAVEFESLDGIRTKYGERGITVPRPAYGFAHPVITDDTQMAIATAQSLCETPPGLLDDTSIVRNHLWRAYLRWYASQDKHSERRAPGSTCLSALRNGVMGSRLEPLNRSAGCGGIMRAHPVGLAYWHRPDRALHVGMESAVLTHGHPNGYVPSGVLAALIARLCAGDSLRDAFERMQEDLATIPQSEQQDTSTVIAEAFAATVDGDYGKIIDRQLGRTSAHAGGWLGHDALAIALYAVRAAPDDPIEAVHIAVNHSGDSDSTGSIAGAIMGALYGSSAFEAAIEGHGIKLEREKELRFLAAELVRNGSMLKEATL